MPLRRILLPLVAAALVTVGLSAPARAAVGASTPYPLATGATPIGVVLGPDKNIWVATGSANSIARVAADGTVTNFPVPTAGANPRSITVGSDGNLWFTQQTGNKIGRITTSGQITEFPIPTANSEPYAITPGPDGNLWFTEFAGNKIGRITTSGQITEFPIPTANAGPYDIEAGPTGSPNLYFTESTGDKLGMITSSGVITEMALAAGSRPRGIVATDTLLWFAQHGTSKIGQLQGNSILELSLPAGAQPSMLAIGPGPTIWVSMTGSSQVAELTTAGSVQGTYALASGSAPMGLAQGSDGNMWVALSGGAAIARVLTGQIPQLVTAPSISPTSGSVGATFTTTTGIWDYVPTTFEYQWQRCTTRDLTACTDIAGAKASTYTAVAADNAQFLQAAITASNANGAGRPARSSGVTVGSATPVPAPTPKPTVPVQTTVTVDAPVKIKRGKAKPITVTIAPANAAGTMSVTVKKGRKTKVFSGLQPVSGLVTVTWKVTKKWPTGSTRVIAVFTPATGAAFTAARGTDRVTVR